MSGLRVGQSKKVREMKEYLRNEGITQEAVRFLFNYDPESGVVSRRVFVNSRAKEGDTVGFLESNGYLRVRINNRSYMLHRIIWLWMEGYFPENQIDHENHVRQDNRWCNLREVSSSCNMRNASVQERNKSGVTGVCLTKDKTWQVSISKFRANTYIGRYDDFTEAVCHRYAAEQCLGYPNCNSTSSAYLYLKEQGIVK